MQEGSGGFFSCTHNAMCPMLTIRLQLDANPNYLQWGMFRVCVMRNWKAVDKTKPHTKNGYSSSRQTQCR